MKKVFGCLIGLLVLGVACIAIYFLIQTALVAGYTTTMPFGQETALDWMMGTPVANSDLNVGVGSGRILDVGTLAFNGYSGDESFICSVLVQDVKTYVTDKYGTYRSSTYRHSGIDYGTNHTNGHPVITPMGGQVVYTGNYGGWGYTVAIENNGHQVLLTHAQDINVEVGDIVSAGDVVMLSGGGAGDDRDGSSTGSHLHYEVRVCSQDSSGGVSCKAHDPTNTLLPGQTQICDWYSQTSNGPSD